MLDFGSQTAQLIARRLREARVRALLLPHDVAPNQALTDDTVGFVLSGGPNSVYQSGAPAIPDYVFESGLPLLGICYGMQALTHQLGGQVSAANQREFGSATLSVDQPNALLPAGTQTVWMSHGDRIDSPPAGFVVCASSDNSPVAAIADADRSYYGLQFHPEVQHTPSGAQLLGDFALRVCSAAPDWTPESIIEEQVAAVQQQVDGKRALAAVSGGVDSSVAAALVQRAIGDRLTCVFIDTGLLRQGEPQAVVEAFEGSLRTQLIVVEAQSEFFGALSGVTDPEEKRRRIGEAFIRTFERAAAEAGQFDFLVQGTIYPDVIESSAPERPAAARIKTHHNVGGLPEKLDFELVEPLRYLFKDEVRSLGHTLGLPASLIERQPFPGPGLAVRCLGDVSPERVQRLRQADNIFLQSLHADGLLGADTGETRRVAQAFAVLLPVRSVGVMGDGRTYGETIVLRAVSTDDFMTADWSRLTHELLAHVSTRITNEVAGVTRVVFDVTSKPPATIEWE